MKNLYKVISVILIVIMIGISMPSDLFALRPVAHKLTRQLYNGPVSPKNYAILTTPTEGSRQFISENTALVKLEFSLLTIEKIKDFLQKHDITIHDLHTIPLEKLSLLVYLMRELPPEHIAGLRLRFVRNLLPKSIRGLYLSPIDTIFLHNRLDMTDLPFIFLREIGHRVGKRTDKKIKNDFYKTRWKMIPFLGTMILFPLGVVASIYLIAPMIISLFEFPAWPVYLINIILIKWSFDKLFTGNLIKESGAKKVLFFNMFSLYIRKKNFKSYISDFSGITPSKYFADAYSTYPLLNQEFSRSAEDDDQIKGAYEILESRVFKGKYSRPSLKDRAGIDKQDSQYLDPAQRLVVIDYSQEERDRIMRETLLENIILTTAGDINGKHAFTIALSAYDRENMQIFLKGQEQPDVVFLTLNPLVNSSALEGLFFQRMFFDPIVKGYSARYEKLLQDLEPLTKEDPNYSRKIEEIDTFKYEVIDAGYDIDLLVKGLISGKLTVIVNSEEDKSRVLRMVKAFFIGKDANFYKTKLVDNGYGQKIAKMLSEEFAYNRPFHFSGGLFNRDGKGSLKSDEALDSLVDKIIDIQVLAPGDTITLHKGTPAFQVPANTLEIERRGDSYLITEGAQRYYIGGECLKLQADGLFYSSWTRREVSMVEKVISLSTQDEDELIIMPLGNADLTPFSGKQDYTNLLLAYNGRAILVDPSTQTLRNMKAKELLDRVDAFYLSHVHWDHFGGMIDFAYQQLSAQASNTQTSSMPLIAAAAVYETAFDYLNALTSIGRYEFEKIFPLVKTKKEIDREVVLFNDKLPDFAQMEMILNRTFGHTLPTYGFKISTKKGVFAYLSDSLMPSENNPLRLKFIEFFKNGVDLLISENGGAGVHITPHELIKAFRELVDIGVMYTDHSADPQNQLGLQRAQVFEPLKIIKRGNRYKDIKRVNSLLRVSNAVKVGDENILLGDFIIKQFATIGRIEEIEKSRIIYREGDPVSDNPYLYIILSGSVNVEGIRGVPNNRISLGKGHVLGEMAILRRALTSYTEDDLRILFEKELISQQFIAGVGYYVWKITDIAEIKNLKLDEGLDNRLVSLFSDSKQLPRSKTVVADEESILLRIHIDEFIKLLDTEFKESDSTSPLARSLQMIMEHRHNRDKRVKGFLAPIRPGVMTAILPVTEKTSSAGTETSMNGTEVSEELFDDDYQELLYLLEQVPGKLNMLKLTSISERISGLSARVGSAPLLTPKLPPLIELYSDNVAASDVLINFANSLANVATRQESIPVLLKLLSETNVFMVKISLTDIIIKLCKQDLHSMPTEQLIETMLDMLKIGYPYTWKKALLYLVNDIGEGCIDDLKAAVKSISDDNNKKILVERAISILTQNKNRLVQESGVFAQFCTDILDKTHEDNLRIIDLGANAGSFARDAKYFTWGQNAKITSIDSKKDIPFLALYLNMVKVIKMNWANLEFQDNTFDLVTLNSPNPSVGLRGVRQALREGFRICKEGGGVSFLSCITEDDGFEDPMEIIEVLKEVGFSEDIRLLDYSKMSIDYPVTEASNQVENNVQYLIIARKPSKGLALDLSMIDAQSMSEVMYEKKIDPGKLNISVKSSSSGWREKFIKEVENAVKRLVAEEGELPTAQNVARELGYNKTGLLTRRAKRLKVDLRLLGVLFNRDIFILDIKNAVKKLTEEGKLLTRLNVARELGYNKTGPLTRRAKRLNVDLRLLEVLSNRDVFIQDIEAAVKKLAEEGELPTAQNVARELGYNKTGLLTRRAKRLKVDLRLLGVLFNRDIFILDIKNAVKKLTEEGKPPTRLNVARELGYDETSQLTRRADDLDVDLRALGVLFNRDVLMQELKGAVKKLTKEDKPLTNLNVARELSYPNTSPLTRRAKRNKIDLNFAISS